MKPNNLAYHQFADDLTLSQEILRPISESKNWDEKFRLLLLAGKRFPPHIEFIQKDDFLIRGCESKAWLSCQSIDHKIQIIAFAESKIIKGLLILLISQINGKTKEEVLNFNAEFYFEKLGLDRHLSESRKGGLHILWKHILILVKSF
jgi:sulfur transfer protein SufE